ncbi:ferritin-like protein [Kribbella sp. NPDC056345]|uniref:ferritin-like domain-containing protein n=1 Tax=Kribbella sp. NPDC056345 TaxID=3345789 RepID=UPI0035E1480F
MNAPDTTAIDTVESLRTHLQWAVELEHATIPPYLYALYSLDPARNPDAVELVSSVFVEEMVHLSLAANLLNAVGGEPRLDTPEMLAPYPRLLPHGSVKLSLLPFGPEALEMFLALEKPEAPTGPPESDHYETIGQFYDAIEAGFRFLCDSLGPDQVFTGDPARQVTFGAFHHTDGKLAAVTDLASALAALEEIVEQGEGAAGGAIWDGDHDIMHPDRDEVAHYYRFEELRLGRRYQRGDTATSGPTGEPVTVDPAGLHPLSTGATTAEIRQAQVAFDNTYCTILYLLQEAFTGDPAQLRDAVRTMFGLKAQATALFQSGAGPTFTYIPPDERI